MDMVLTWLYLFHEWYLFYFGIDHIRAHIELLFSVSLSLHELLSELKMNIWKTRILDKCNMVFWIGRAQKYQIHDILWYYNNIVIPFAM